MVFRKLVAFFLLALLASRIAIAQNKNEQFTFLRAKEPAPFEGYLFTPESITKIYSVCTEEVKKKELECTSDIKNLTLDIDKLKEETNIEIAVKDKLIKDITKLKDEEILAREKLLNNIEEERKRNMLFIAGSFVAGIILTGSIVYFVAGSIR